MKIITWLKRNTIARAVYSLYKNYLDFGRFGYIADNVIVTPPHWLNKKSNIQIYEGTNIGAHSYISAYNARFIVKKNCAIAEGLTVHTGNHARVLGKFITQITEENKPKGYDKDVIVNEDCWIGSNVTLLCGITIGRGSTIAAGSVVNKDIPPYCVAGGVPAKVIKPVWTIDEILKHEAELYPPEERYTREQLEQIMSKYGK